MSKFVTRFLKDESGATAIEYGLIAALVGILIIAALGFLGQALDNAFSSVATQINRSASN